MPSDRSLTINATPTLTWSGSTVTGVSMSYDQGPSQPPMKNVVDKKTGFIDLSKMPVDNGYTDNIDILMTLCSSGIVDPGGNPVEMTWGNLGDPTNNPMTGTPPNTPWAWFCQTPPLGQPYDRTPISVANMAMVRTSDTVVTIDDNTPLTSASYVFCLGLVLWPITVRQFFTIDPIIGTKGKGTSK